MLLVGMMRLLRLWQSISRLEYLIPVHFAVYIAKPLRTFRVLLKLVLSILWAAAVVALRSILSEWYILNYTKIRGFTK